MELIFLLVGCVLGGALGWLVGAKRASKDHDEGPLAAAQAAHQAEVARRKEAESTASDERLARNVVERREAAATEQARQVALQLAEERAFVQRAKSELETAFKAAAADALQGNSGQFLELAKQRMDAQRELAGAELDARRLAIEALLKPITESIQKLEGQTSALEQARVQAYATLGEQVRALSLAAEGVQRETLTLATALKGSQQRGAWGEVALRNVVELAGMTEYCDFDEQHTVDDGKRPDMVVRLPGGRRIAVDSKASVAHYLEAAAATTDSERSAALKKHGQAVRSRVKELQSKDYAAHLAGSVDLVVLFLPGEAFLAAALSVDHELHAESLRQKVLVTAPTNLVALLRTVAVYHQQEALARDAQQVADAARALYERGVAFAGHLSSVGSGLSSAIRAYNSAVGSFETRFLPAGRKLDQLKVTALSGKRLEAPATIDVSPRTTSNPPDSAPSGLSDTQ